MRLFLTGWVYWVNSSGMLALSSRRDLALEPPALQVKDTEGRWVTVIEDLGIPSGINRTLMADLTGKFLSADRSVRIATNLAVYWDEAFFATETGPVSPTLHRLAPVEGDLHHRGFSVPVREERSSRPDSFDYARSLEPSPWNAAPGLYTRFGTVGTLLAASDNHLVVMAAGDELTLAFDAAAFPPLPEGSRRDFILHFTGWAKDHEPATLTAGSVEPLPFHGMAAYPPPPGEGFAVMPEADAYRQEFQTRRMPRLVPDLAPLVAR